MSLHSYSRVWVHLVWGTLERRPVLAEAAAAKVHALVDLPTCLAIEDMMHLLNGSSSHWINERNLLPGKFAWGRGYGAFSVSHSGVGEVAKYIAGQEEHHRQRSFAEELKLLVERYGLKWQEDKTVETVLPGTGAPAPPR